MKLIYPKKFVVKPTELTVEEWHGPTTSYKHDKHRMSQGSIEILIALRYTGPMYVWFPDKKNKYNQKKERMAVYFDWKKGFDPGKTWTEWERESQAYLP